MCVFISQKVISRPEDKPVTAIRVTTEYGIVIRRSALIEKQISFAQLLEAMESDQPFDADEALISFGPSFGEEAMHEFVRRLEKVGLYIYDDFFTVALDVPPWCQFTVSIA
jgi:hypothetical protein